MSYGRFALFVYSLHCWITLCKQVRQYTVEHHVCKKFNCDARVQRLCLFLQENRPQGHDCDRMNANCMRLEKAVAAPCCEGTLVYTLARQRAKAGRLYVRMNGFDSDLGRCETIGLSATHQVTATSPSNLALPVHRPLHVYDTYTIYGTKRARTI